MDEIKIKYDLVVNILRARIDYINFLQLYNLIETGFDGYLKISVDGDRLWDSIIEIGEIGREDGGLNRLALTDADKEVRDRYVDLLHDEGLEVKIDKIGNIFGIRKGQEKNKLPIMIGSHLDTVKNAGIFDGALGVISGLEIVRLLNYHNIETSRNIAVAAFTNEEGARFQPDMMGSMVFSNHLSIDEAYCSKDDEDITVKDELTRIGYLGNDEIKPGYYLELHVEQGPVLDRGGHEIGVVEGVQGMAWWDGQYIGEANHAGTTPISLRKDALYATAELCYRFRLIAENMDQNTVTTMGRLNLIPNIRNVIPGKVIFSLDFRQYDEELYQKGQLDVIKLVKEVADQHNMDYSLIQTVDAKPVRFDPRMVKLVEEKTKELELSYIRMYSGAGHDAQFVNNICPTSMVFVPSIGGRSHCKDESSTKKDCINGANVLLRCILKLAQM
jgi:N-carbamoyl-L-amino-acid hydrolase